MILSRPTANYANHCSSNDRPEKTTAGVGGLWRKAPGTKARPLLFSLAEAPPTTDTLSHIWQPLRDFFGETPLRAGEYLDRTLVGSRGWRANSWDSWRISHSLVYLYWGNGTVLLNL